MVYSKYFACIRIGCGISMFEKKSAYEITVTWILLLSKEARLWFFKNISKFSIKCSKESKDLKYHFENIALL